MGIQDAKETGEGGGGGLMNRLVAAEALTQEGRKKLRDATCMFRSDIRRFVGSLSRKRRARARERGRTTLRSFVCKVRHNRHSKPA
jgi:hypothetical protein